MAFDRPFPVDALFTGTLLASLALHAVFLAALPGWKFESERISELLTVELQPPPPPKPLPPPEPPKPEPEKPKEPPKKLQPKPLREPPPAMPTETPPPPEPERVAETPPQIMAAEPKPSAEAPPAFVVPEPPPEPPPRPKGPTDQDIDAAKGNYGSLLSREFSRHKQYPRMAQIRGWQGTTRVELHIDPNGTVTSSSVRESSGFEVLDKQALEMVRKASPLPLPPEVLRGREFTIVVPVAFRLE